MRADKLMEHPETAAGAVQKQAKVEVPGGTVGIVYYPPPAGSQDMPMFDLLNGHLIGWDATDENGLPAALNADIIVALSSEVKDAFRDAILGRRTKPEPKPAVKPEERQSGSFGDNPPKESKRD